MAQFRWGKNRCIAQCLANSVKSILYSYYEFNRPISQMLESGDNGLLSSPYTISINDQQENVQEKT